MSLLVSLERDLGDLAEHDRGVAIEEGNAGEAVARLEVVDHEGVLGLEDRLCDLVGLERHGGLELLATGLVGFHQTLRAWAKAVCPCTNLTGFSMTSIRCTAPRQLWQCWPERLWIVSAQPWQSP